MCTLENRKDKSAGGYLWWRCKDTDVYDKNIMVDWVGNVPQDYRKAIISKLKLANGDYLEQWHASRREAGPTLSTAKKTVYQTKISACCLGKRKSHQGYQFRRVTTEKIEDFDKDGKRIIQSKKRKALSPI
jgi:hypothetical protein